MIGWITKRSNTAVLQTLERVALALTVVLALRSNVGASAPPLNGTGAANNRVVLLTMPLTDGAQQYMDQLDNRVAQIPMLYGADIDPDHDLRPNWDLVTNALDRRCPPGYNGVIGLDWEAEFFVSLKEGPSGANFQTAMNKGKALLNYVKSERPLAKVGFYGLPTAHWPIDSHLLQPLFDQMDVLLPSAYMADNMTNAQNRDKLHNNVELALELAHGKPVVVFHSPRFAGRGGGKANQIIDRDEFIDFLESTFSVEVNGKRAAGVVLWDMTTFWLKRGQLQTVDRAYIPAGMDIDTYATQVLRFYICAAMQAVIPGMNCSQEMPNVSSNAVAGEATAPPAPPGNPANANRSLAKRTTIIETDPSSVSNSSGSSGAAFASASNATGAGVNIAPLNPLISGSSFTNLVWTSSPWQLKDANGSAIDADMSECGYPMPGPGQVAETVIGANKRSILPPGKWLCLYEGEGKVEFTGDAQVVRETPGQIVLRVAPTSAGVTLRLSEVSTGDPVRNIRVVPFSVMRGVPSSAQLHPQLVNRLRSERPDVLRFASWQHIDDSPIVNWEDRITLDASSQRTERGAALELMIALCNELDCDVWLSVPHAATDEFVQSMAKLVHKQLGANRRLYLEYSNDVLNPNHAQFAYAAEHGHELMSDSSDAEAAAKFYGRRGKEIFDLVRAEFTGAPNRLVCVYSVPGDAPESAALLLARTGAVASADVISVSGGIGGAEFVHELGLLSSGLTIDRVVSMLQESRANRMPDFKNVAAQVLATGKPMIVSSTGAGMLVLADGFDKQLISILRKAEKDPRVISMGDNERRYWEGAGAAIVLSDDTPVGEP